MSKLFNQLVDASVPNSQLVIRPESAHDIEAIHRLVEAAFRRSKEADLVDLIRQSPEYVPELSLVAVTNGKMVGHTMLSYSEIKDDDMAYKVLSLAPLAVIPEMQGRGIGGKLVRRALEEAEQRGEPLVMLEGNPDYYVRFGFEDSRKYGIYFALPDWAPANAGQIYRLSKYDSSIRGWVHYAPAFSLVQDASRT